MKNARTDMAEELRRQHAEDIYGVECKEEILHGMSVFSVNIKNGNGAKVIGKPIGKYHTLCLPKWFDRGSEFFIDAVYAMAELINRCFPNKHDNVLIAALGNPDITPDALGSLTAESVLVTRHLKESDKEKFSRFCSLALCRTGVLGTTGIESAVQISMLCRELKPDLVIVVDALAGAEADRLCRSVQVSNSGICPGSGVGNDRKEISFSTLGVPVISIGIPTVIDAGYFAGDILNGMFVTPRDIDSLVRAGGRLIGYAINIALHEGLNIEDVDALLG